MYPIFSTRDGLKALAAVSLIMLSACAANTGLAKTKAAPAGVASGTCVMATEEAVADLFRKWNLSLATLDSSKVAALYWPDAVLLPTVSNIPRTDTAAITDYFDHFLQKFPRGKILTRTVYRDCGVALDMGTYEFSLMDPAGEPSTVRARYTYAYTYRNGAWKIQHHHSSAMPEPVTDVSTPHAAAKPSTHDDKSTHDTHDTHDTHGTHDQPAAPVAKSDPAPTTNSRSAAPRAARLQLDSAPRTPDALLSAEQRKKVGRETVGLKICATGDSGSRSVDVSDPAPHAEANSAAVAWAQEARWKVIGGADAAAPVCAQVVVRFTDAGI
ncbi:MAG: SgcJ/EcaC family oxidoreductase [Gammaproteobacteria bacterium]